MKKFLKLTVICMMISVMLLSFGVSAFAANASYSKKATAYSQELIDVTCNYYSLWKDTFTIKNNGTVTMWVYVNRCYAAEIRPGQSYTYPKTHHFKDRVQVYAKTPGSGTQKISISSTSGNIYNT